MGRLAGCMWTIIGKELRVCDRTADVVGNGFFITWWTICFFAWFRHFFLGGAAAFCFLEFYFCLVSTISGFSLEGSLVHGLRW